MLGNWSFGDYFKKEAIKLAWELLTKVYGLDPDRLYVTYFEGDNAGGLEPDLEAKQLWSDVGVADDHILPGNMKDNFWEMGDQGPCGPCSELHYDRIGGRNAAHLVNMDDPNVLEIWNLVFIQYNRESDKSLRPLPNKHVDTGLGYERLVSVLQGKSSNYDTDVFTPLFKVIQEVTGAREYRGKFGDEDPDGIDTAYRVVADHVRLLTFAIADGGVPDKDGRGYVVRRVLRRGVRYARKYFSTEIGDFFSKIVPRLVEQMGDMFPEIKKKESDIKEILNEEERSFAKTLDRGEIMFEKYAQQCKARGSLDLPGHEVWRLYDTYGFPVDLTRIMAEERGLRINDRDVEEAQEKAREASKGEKKALADTIKLDVHDLGKLERMKDVPKTDDSAKFGRVNITSQIKLVYHNKTFLQTTKDTPEGEQIGLLLDRTNFYSEQGGQEFDTGKILIDDVAEIDVQNVQIYAGYVLHTGYMKYGTLNSGDEVVCEYDELRRFPIRNNHTGTHILNLALREVLGEEINQKGSLVAPEKLRFDFSHKSQISDADLAKIEDISTQNICQNMEVFSRDVPLATAHSINGVRAVFGETYPDPVRVVSVGVSVEDLLADAGNADWHHVSVEFCGGTHVDNTSEIKKLVVLEESGISKGVRRIIAVTGVAATEVQRTADTFEAERLVPLERAAHSPQKEQDAKAVQVALNELVIPAVRKAEFRERFGKVNRGILDEQKAATKRENKVLVDRIGAHFQDEGNAKSKVMVMRVELSSGSKAINEALKHVSSKEKDKNVYLIAADEKEGKVMHGCYLSEVSSFASIPLLVVRSRVTHCCNTILYSGVLLMFASNQDLAKNGASASDWANSVAGAVGGKAGGKGATSIGSGTNVDKVDEGLKQATEYLKKFGL